MSEDKFKQCPLCKTWFGLEDFLRNPDIEPIGMMIADELASDNLYFFNHVCEGCGTTLTLSIKDFIGFIEEPIPPIVNFNSESCEGHCKTLSDTGECNQECRYAPFRRFLQKLMQSRREKKGANTPH